MLYIKVQLKGTWAGGNVDRDGVMVIIVLAELMLIKRERVREMDRRT